MSPPPIDEPADSPSLAAVARVLVGLAAGWFLLRELGPVLKPLFLAVLLGYVIIPLHVRVKRHVPGRLSVVVLAVVSLATIALASWMIQFSVRALAAELDKSNGGTPSKVESLRHDFVARYPWLAGVAGAVAQAEQEGEGHLRDYTSRLVAMAADTVVAAAVVGLYLLFLLVEAGRFPLRVRQAFSEPRAARIMAMVAGVNRGIATYLTAKVKSSFMLAVPVFIVLFVFEVRLVVAWTVVTFFCNFVPYIGSVVAYSLPTGFALLQFGLGWEAITVAVLLLAVHLVTASVVEPRVIGRAVGVSPMLILLALAFWGHCWGLTGMLLAVPLTVMAKITCEHIEATRPLARLVSDE